MSFVTGSYGNKKNNFTLFEESISNLSNVFNQLFLQISEIRGCKKAKNSANLFLNLLVDETLKEDYQEKFYVEIIQNLPKGIWNYDTIDLIENKLSSLFNQDFVKKMKKEFNFESDKAKNIFLRETLSNMIGMQIMGFKLLGEDLSKTSLYEQNRLNLRLSRELLQTIELLVNKNSDFVRYMNTKKNLLSIEFQRALKSYWKITTLLFLRISDILFSYNKKEIGILEKKLGFLAIERQKIILL
ncbi:MAG: hypothetical protein ACOCXG_03985 [Nanoarchaeota archaeon]